tara:strand:+ start:10246 stop:11094 length:849 start_codon:yes stop_codon:yes gene_type:complete
MKWNQTALSRKSHTYIKQGIKRLNINKSNPLIAPVLVNSFPKSGTHLLYQVIQGIPQLRNYETFLASTPSFTMREQTQKRMVKKISSWVPGEIVRGHVFHTDLIENTLSENRCIQLFIYRDPRDVVCSEAHYLGKINRWHRLHGAFKNLPDDSSRYKLAISGDIGGKLPVEYQNIKERFNRYKNWIKSPEVFPVKFEDLVGDNRNETVMGIVNFLMQQIPDVDDDIHEMCLQQIQPEKSHTYRRGGGVSNWQKRFSPEHKELFKEVAGNLLIELGYEKDLSW